MDEVQEVYQEWFNEGTGVPRSASVAVLMAFVVIGGAVLSLWWPEMCSLLFDRWVCAGL